MDDVTVAAAVDTDEKGLGDRAQGTGPRGWPPRAPRCSAITPTQVLHPHWSLLQHSPGGRKDRSSPKHQAGGSSLIKRAHREPSGLFSPAGVKDGVMELRVPPLLSRVASGETFHLAGFQSVPLRNGTPALAHRIGFEE